MAWMRVGLVVCSKDISPMMGEVGDRGVWLCGLGVMGGMRRRGR